MARKAVDKAAGQVKLEEQQEADGRPKQEEQPEPEGQQESEGQPKPEGQQEPGEQPKSESQPKQDAHRKYKITAPRKITKVIGGVSFTDGTGICGDSFTASWFRNKGYGVKEVQHGSQHSGSA